ncbi:ADP-ribosyl cyclase/cyclic ADP-ribose hydrolase 1-like [Embiotoca jacksoni]|uniref:ADP-ribosyl cyclase/cyclic ADP-ribose hydrolase 1-like n=1 Tax=Embiotoca jacksoni TaxID=100190 RepID=UPI003703CD49
MNWVYFALAVVGVGCTLIVMVVPLVLLLPQTDQFRKEFMKRCEKYPEKQERCKEVLSAIEEAYVGKDPCNFPEEAYDQLFTKFPFTHPCNKTMFWCNTTDLVHKFTEERNHFFTLEDTLLGFIMNGWTWWEEKGSNGEDQWFFSNPDFADYACGNTTVMLDGQRSKPFDPDTYFARIELKRLKYPRVTKLQVILITENKNKCDSDSLKELRKVLDNNISYSCKGIASAQIEECIKKR